MSYTLMLSYNNGAEKIYLPVLPEKIEVNQSGNSKSYDISQLGEVQVLTGQKLLDISFSGIFPAHPLYASGQEPGAFQEPLHYYQTLEKWLSNQKPIRLTFIGSTLNLDLPVSIESFTYSESGGAVGDISYTLKLKEYRYYTAKKPAVEQPGGAKAAAAPAGTNAPVRPDTRVQPKTYTLVSGDSLWKVAQKLLGSGARYKEIQKLNGIQDSELRRLPVGKVLKLP
ncbi:LysM peptidoglycan-binding domain-containing protein [Paenibacillus antibioticophila]|uniref:LysM peptidoglycan-binding domain-containing protein n=1 Tax=Paenibacillus antibioticophila TaxID=1274374 RepID=UPI0005CA9E70|nr:LysM peptidoglycan-binding domain-containing protein [Paenibacillus antibioticophila]